jgi:Tol biopolymer transport system component
MPIGGGAPRAICEDVREAVWTHDGKDLIVTRDIGGRHHIECPIGNVLYESGHWISQIRPSPSGDRFGFIEHLLFGDDGGAAVIIDRNGKEIARSSTWGSTSGLAWNPKGDEVWLSSEGDAGRNIFAVGVAGPERIVLSLPGRHSLHDIAPDGRLLMGIEDGRREAVVGHPGDPKERNLTWFDWSWIGGLSEDGKMVLLVEQAAGVHGRNTIYVRPVDGGPAMRIGEGTARGKPISRDGQWIVAEVSQRPSRLDILPIGTGQVRPIPMQTIENVLGWQLFSDNRRLAVLGQQAGEPLHLFELTIDGSKPPRQISPLPIAWPIVMSNDEHTIAATGPDDRVILIPVNGGEPQRVESCGPGDVPIGWTTDNRALWVYHRARTNASIDRADISGTGRTRWHTIQPADSAGILDIMPVHITADGQTYGYGYRRVVSDLYVVSGLI